MAPGIFDKFKKFITMESEEIEFDQLESAEFQNPLIEPQRPLKEEPVQVKKNTVIPTHGATRKQEIVVFQPGTFNEAQQVAEHIKARKTVVINVKRTDKDLAKRIIDFLSGINYATDGNVQKIADNIFLFVPSHIEVTIVDQNDSTISEEPLFTRR